MCVKSWAKVEKLLIKYSKASILMTFFLFIYIIIVSYNNLSKMIRMNSEHLVMLWTTFLKQQKKKKENSNPENYENRSIANCILERVHYLHSAYCDTQQTILLSTLHWSGGRNRKCEINSLSASCVCMCLDEKRWAKSRCRIWLNRFLV